MNESIVIALVEELKKLNENIEQYNDILISHYISTGEIEMEPVDLDS